MQTLKLELVNVGKFADNFNATAFFLLPTGKRLLFAITEGEWEDLKDSYFWERRECKTVYEYTPIDIIDE